MINGKVRFCPQCGTPVTEKKHSGKLRPACPNCEWVYFPDPKVAVAVLLRKNDQVLLVQRKYDPQKGFWTLPSGFIDAGEDPKLAAERECLEETGLKIINLELLDVVFNQVHPRGASILIIYKAKVLPGDLVPADDASQAAYFMISDLPPLAFASTRQILANYF